MFLMRTSLLAALGVALVACSAPTSEEVGSGEQASLSDVVSIVQRPDGRFDVFCRGRDGAPDFTQTVEASAIHDDSVCSPPAPPRPSVVPVGNRRVAIPTHASNRTLEQWGVDTWEGFASFDVQVQGGNGYNMAATLVDGSGASYPLSTTRTRYERLPTPIKVIGSSNPYYAGEVVFSATSVEVTKTTSTPGLASKYAGTGLTLLKTIAPELPNAPVTLTVGATFFKNFTNGNACSRASIVDAAGQSVTLDPETPSRRATLKAPIRVQVQQTCISSRLAAPENGDADVDVDVSRIEIGAASP
ncbi:MAG: hypothetical protein KIT84_19890 [Labilithrix sp.]|nr:hypothetical protein [Labilithrix sp.]MCW5813300.1 hypothetical protein [Labilithrix sp.]